MRFTAELDYSNRELARIRLDLAYADATALSSQMEARERSATIRAHAYVWLAAVLERSVKDAIRSTLRELTALGLPCNELRASLFALICDPTFMSIAERNRQKGLSMRVALLNRLVEATPAAFLDDILPLDGRTLRAEHFDTIWEVLGLHGPSLPGPLHRIALKDLSDGRNDVAHGVLDPVLFGKAKATSDVRRLATRVDEIISHFLTALDDYLSAKRYRR